MRNRALLFAFLLAASPALAGQVPNPANVPAALTSGNPVVANGPQSIADGGAPTGTGAFVKAGSPGLTGTPTAPTPSSSDNSTTIATTAFVKAQGCPAATSAAAGCVQYENCNSAWVPIDNSGASLTLTVVSKSCYRVNDLVTVIAFIIWPSNVSAASASLGGLPYTAAGYTGVGLFDGTGANAQMYIAGAGTVFNISDRTTGAAIPNSTFSGKYFILSATYSK